LLRCVGFLSCGDRGFGPTTEPNSDRPNSGLYGRRLCVGANLHPAAVTESDRRIEDDLLARRHSGVRFNPRAEVARYCQSAYLSLTVVDHRDLQAIAVEDDRFGRHDEGRVGRGILSSTVQ
jgi:hypothetical protein